MSELEIEECEYQKVSNLKDSIKSNLIKNMLIAEDLEYGNKQINDKKIKKNENNNKNSKQKNEKEIPNIGNIGNNRQIPINKIKPQSKTLIQLINGNKNNVKEFKKKLGINSRNNNPKIINKKSLSVKNIEINSNEKNINLTQLSMNNKKISNKKNVNLNLNKIPVNRNINNLKQNSFSHNTIDKIDKPKPNNIYLNSLNSSNENKIIKTAPNINNNHKNEIENHLLNNKNKDKCHTQGNKAEFKKKNKSKIEHNNKNNNKCIKNKNPKKIIKVDNNSNNNNISIEKNINDFREFLSLNELEKNKYAPEIANILEKFKKGNKFIKKIIYLPEYHYYTHDQIIKDLLFKDILSFLLPFEQYLFAKSNKKSLIQYMKIKGSETELLLDNYNLLKVKMEQKLNKNKNKNNKNNNITLTVKNFFNNEKINKIIKLLNDEIYLEIFNDKKNTPNDNIIFVYKLFFLLIKNTDKIIKLKNNEFWEKICDFFIYHTNEFNQSNLLLGDFVKKILEQKMNWSKENLVKIYEILNLIDLNQINPTIFSKDSPTTSQFCFIIQYFLEFFGIIDNEWSPLENEYVMLQHKMQNLIKKINKIGLYIVNLKYINENKE